MADYIVLWNTSQHEISLEHLKVDSQLIWLLASLLSFISWAIYITFYNSRIFGLLLTRLINRWLIKCGYFKIGSITINPLAGKVMFREVVYICADYSIRVQDGYIIFRWWRSYVPKDISEDLSYSDTRLSLTLNGFEVHAYNRSELYSKLEHTFGLNPSLLIPTECMSAEESNAVKERKFNQQKMEAAFKNVKKSEAMTAISWRDLIPVTKIDISAGRFVLGNRVTPTTLTISVEEAHCVYSTKPAACVLDHFMHFVKAKIENAKVMFAPSLKYTGLADEPPRYMGEGFVVMMSNMMQLYFYMDEPGTVPEQPVQLTLANGDVIESVPPVFGIDIKCGKGTDFSYGPWADRQRDNLFKFFFPPDWQEMKSNEPLKPGDTRQYQSFDISLCTLNEATLDVLFSKEKETNAMHVTVGAGSCIEVTIPWIVETNGYIVQVSGQLLHMEATTSLQYRSLSECESLEYKIRVHYPKRWNDCQDWKINLRGCKATIFLIYKHKSFFQDLIDDWSSKARSDVISFVPYVCKINILLKEFEILTISNEYNWIDCSSANQENHHLGFCGDLFDLSFVLPFNDFLPKTLTIKFWFHVEGMDLRFYLPEISTSRTVVLAIDQNANIQTRSGKIKNRLELYSKKWRKICMQRHGWIDCWSAPIIALSIQYTYHPIPLLGPDPQADITTPEKEEILLSPMRIPKVKKSPIINWFDAQEFDPAQLPADKVIVDLEIGSSILMAYGSVLRNFIHLKENIFGEDQIFTDMEESSSKIRIKKTSSSKDIFLAKYPDIQSVPNVTNTEEMQKQLDPREYRPLDVVVSVTLHDIQAHLMKNCNESEHCPVILIDRIGFEMNKTFVETQLQVLVSPSFLLVTDDIIRQSQETHLKQGHILLSALQVRGHAMFSNQGRHIEEETLEYAWLLEIQLGKLSAKLSLPQLANILIALEIFVFLTVDHENCSKTSKLVQNCHHGLPTNRCSQTNELIKYRCPSSEDIKYKMTRVSIDVIDFYLVEVGTAFHGWLSPVRFAVCNLHGPKIKYGVSGLISTVLFRQFLANNVGSVDSSLSCTDDRFIDQFKNLNNHLEERSEKEFSKEEQNIKVYLKANAAETQRSHGKFSGEKLERRMLIELNNEWMEVGSMCLGPISLESASALPISDHKLHLAQQNFLRDHDQNWRRLWFLWATNNDSEFPKCGCIGGCAFFGNNRNGSKFFKPSSSDIQDNYNIADYKILTGEKDIGFGESILYSNQLVFHTPPYSLKRIHLRETYELFDQVELKDTVDNEFNIFNEHWSARDERYKQKPEILHCDENIPILLKHPPKSKKSSSNGLPKCLSPVDVPYTRLLDISSKQHQNPVHVECNADKLSKLRRYDMENKSSKNVNIRSSKSYVSDSKLIGSKKKCDTTTVLDAEQISKFAQSAPRYNSEMEKTSISEHSILMGLRSDCDPPAVYRASSYASDPSEFFSADEDMANITSLSQNYVDQNIDRLSGRPQSLVELDETAQRFHSSVTPVRKNMHCNHQKQDVSAKDIRSGSPSLSSGSFISAMSSQEELESINLHSEVNRSNLHSPVLMASYLNNLAQFCCPNWNCCSFPLEADVFSVPLFEENGENILTYIGSKKIPRFDVHPNYKKIHILPKSDAKKSSSKIHLGPLKPHPWDPAVLLTKYNNSSCCESKPNEFTSFQRGTVECTSFVVKSTAQVNIFLTPLLLEGLQRMVESLIPYMSKMHVATVVHIMHSFCVRKVRNENILKKDENLCYWSQLLSNSTNERYSQRPENSLLTDVHQEYISTEIKGVIIVPKTSITFLQSSIVSEVSSAIDNVQDLSCVSFLALYIDGISTQLHLGKTTKAAIHNVFIQQRVKSNESHKKGGLVRGTKALLAHLSSQNRSDNVQGEPILIETSEKQLEELVVTIGVDKIHSQFRRLNSTADTSQLSQAIITAIPAYRSRVMFDCKYLSDRKSNEALGSVMFECGLEGISIKLIKRHHFENSENAREKLDLNAANDLYHNTNDISSQASSNDGKVSKAESAWRLISKKPPTPRTPKDKLHQVHEETISVHLANIDDPENIDKQKEKYDTLPKNPEHKAKENDSTSSCLLHFKTVWFNFAAPPSTSITKKIDFSRSDWNLLSTASPAITAWMDPCNRFAIKIVAMQRALQFRHTMIAACLMADALENEQIQRTPKNKKSRYSGTSTLLSKTLQEDPSCQLCILMQLHLIQEGMSKIKSLLIASNVPHLSVLRQGVIVLSRQWKNTLYNPMLFEHQYKNKMIGPLNVTLTFLQTDEETDDVDCDADTETNHFGGTYDLTEGGDNAFLLGQMKNSDLDNQKINKNFLLATPKTYCKSKFSSHKISNTSLVSSSKSSTQNIPIFSGLVDSQNPGIEYGALLEGSRSSTNSINKCSNKTNQKEDLYFWMAKQATYKNKAFDNKENFRIVPLPPTPDHAHNGLQDSITLLDAHLIFEPIMTYLGVMPQQMLNKYNNADISSLDNIGANLSVTGAFDSISVDIVVSEQKSKLRQRKSNQFNNKKVADEPLAFLCEKVEIDLEISKKTDQVANEAKQNVVYISRRQLKKHISTVVNFSLDINFISQQVNMPLLRLLHQISNMYQNVKNAQTDLKNHPLHNRKRYVSKTEETTVSYKGSIPSEINRMAAIGDRCLKSECSEQDANTVEQRTGSFTLDNIEKSPIITSFSIPESSPSTKNRPQSFAQKLRSTGRSVKGKLGYSNLSEMSPFKEEESISAKSNLYKGAEEPRNSINEYNVNLQANSRNSAKKSIWDSNGLTHAIPNCWKTMYNLLELYGNIPEMKTVQRFSFLDGKIRDKRKVKDNTNVLRDENELLDTKHLLPYFRDSERPRLLVFGEVKIARTRLLATLSGLKLEAEITTLSSSTTWCKKVRPTVLECSLTGQVGQTKIVLLEGVAPCQQTVVKITIGKCQLLYSSASKRIRNKNSGLLTIGPVVVDIPQHPVVLHGMMTRSSRQLSTTLQELRVVRTSTRTTKQSDAPNSPVIMRKTRENSAQIHSNCNINNQCTLFKPLIMKFNIILQSFSINAALLPSLQAEYKMVQLSSTGVTGSRGQLVIDLPIHSLSFTTKILSTELNVPPEASLELPDVHVCAEYIPENGSEDKGADGLILRQGDYVSATAKIGPFERSLTTNLLNHLVFVQKVFMKEINEVIQKVYGSEKPVPLFMRESENTSFINTLLYSIDICVTRIQLTATTPCSSAVRFETGTLDFHLSNRVKNIGQNSSRKFFGKANIDFNLSLGQLIKNVIFDEAEPEFHQYAFFNTTIQLRNAFENEMLNNDKELILLVLKRPLIFIQPIAVDKAILVWLSYKNAYEYWTEKRNYLNVNHYQHEEQINDTTAIGQLGTLASSNLSAMFLQLSVEDMGICLPLKQITWGIKNYQEFEPKGAVVITLENTIISACNCGSLVSKGKFVGLCLRFADDFETTLDDWKPNMSDSSIMNFCVVSEGTFEVCSHTIAAKNHDSAKWFLNVKWQMEGVDIHLDVNIGKQLSSLGHTLTMLTGIDDEDPNLVDSLSSDDGDQTLPRDQIKQKELENLPSFVFDPTIDSKTRAIMMQQEMAEQLKIINDLRTLGASYNTIIHEELRLQELQAFCYKYFRRDMIQKKWKRSSMRRGMLKGTNRSQSFIAAPLANEIEAPAKTSETINAENDAQIESNPSRSASLKSSVPIHRPVFSETMRQASLPNTDVHINSNENVVDWLLNEPCGETADDTESTQVEMRPKTNYVNQKQQEPNIDFELNVQVFINSGKCVLHTKNLDPEKILSSTAKYHKRDRSISNNDCGSPTPSRKREKNKIRFNNMNTVLVDLTIFHIPGLDVKLLYESTTYAEETDQINYAILQTKRVVNKRASLFAWIMLQSIPEETIISPHILEFLEQTLEPIPDKSETSALLSNPVNIELLASNNANYASFPVDVIVYFHMQPSTFRFSCLPVSRVECLLQLPSLDIVFSSKRSKDESGSESDIGGVSVTGCLADFNLYIFHPYGGKKSGIKESQFSPLTDSERKDSLSVTVEFVKFHLTRCRKVYIEPPKLKRFENVSKAVIRFSNIIDIGSAFFKYDMRRLTEILAFPKAWYRKKIVKRLFLGDLSVDQSQKDVDVATEANERRRQGLNQTVSSNAKKNRSYKEPLNATNSQETTIPDKVYYLEASSRAGSDVSIAEQNQAWETLVVFAVNFTKLNVHMNMGNVMGNVLWLIRDFQSDGKLSIGNTGYKDLNVGVRLGSSSLDAKGGIVGGIFDISQIDTQLQAREESGKEPYHTIRSKLKALELRLDYMGTSILMCRISSFSAALRDEWKTKKDGIGDILKENAIIFIHADLIWDQLQIMISKSTTADFIKIFYKLEEFFLQQFKSSKRLFSTLESKTSDRFNTIRKKQQQNRISVDRTSNKEPWNDDVRHHRHWQKPLKQAKGFFVSTLKTSLPDSGNILGGTIELHGNNISLACFHGINFKSKSWALFSLREPFINFSTEAQDIGQCDEVHIIETLGFSLGQNTRCIQNHSMAIVSRITRNIVFPPQYKSLAEWFHYAFANSEIDSVDKFPILERDKQITSNSFERNRGQSTNTGSLKSSDLNHNREVIFALPSLQFHFKTEHKQSLSTPDVSGSKPVVVCSFITEFEDHIFVTVDADAFFFLHDLITSYLNEKEKVIGAQIGRAVSPNSLERQDVPKSDKTVLINTENNDMTGASKVNSKQSTQHDEKSDKNLINIDFEKFVRDWRHFECKTWHLEPTVRLLSWAGKSIEPYGIDFILNKLGFSHARITIPKWIQRGFMDPLDKVQAIMMINLLSLGKESHNEMIRNMK